jgi:ribosomal protein S12
MLPPAKPNKALSKIETVALVDAKQAFDAFFPHLPYNIRVGLEHFLRV